MYDRDDAPPCDAPEHDPQEEALYHAWLSYDAGLAPKPEETP
jgi:hypothetical protein